MNMICHPHKVTNLHLIVPVCAGHDPKQEDIDYLCTREGQTLLCSHANFIYVVFLITSWGVCHRGSHKSESSFNRNSYCCLNCYRIGANVTHFFIKNEHEHPHNAALVSCIRYFNHSSGWDGGVFLMSTIVPENKAARLAKNLPLSMPTDSCKLPQCLQCSRENPACPYQ